MNFTHLHVHSHYSLLDGLSKIKPLVKAAKEKGFKAIALTDSGCMYGAIEFYKACQAEEIKPIIGTETYIVNENIKDENRDPKALYFPLVLLATDFASYQNLMRLTSISQTEGLTDGEPRIDKEILKKYSKGVIALSGDIRGEVPSLLKQGKIEEAKKIALEYNKIFGQDNFYLELEDHPAIEGQLDVNTKLIQLSKDTGIPLVVTRDVHYLEPDQAEAQDVLRCIAEGWKVAYTDREDFRHVDRSLNTGEDISSRFRHVEEAIKNTGKIADRVNLEIELDKWHFAPVELPEDKTADEVLYEKAYECAPKFYDPFSDEIKKRIDYELDIIKTKGYAPYFICVADYVKYAKSHGIIETTRGSAAGSVVSYVIGITTVDPMRFKLPFERFLNPFRPSPPDVDTDFADDRREEMIEYVTDKYGFDKVAQIITFGTMAARASVRDVGRTLGLPYSFCDQVAKLVPFGTQGFPMTLERALKEEPDLRKLYETNEDVKRLLDLAQKVEGCARHTSIHAAGVVISPSPLTDFTPVQLEVGGDKLTTQYEMKSVEAAGVLKMDFLGIRNLSILGKAVEIVKATTGDDVDVYSLPLDDQKTFDMLARGETMGTFQLGGAGMTRWLKELKPTNIDDIMAMVALYRPGPMEVIPEYIRRKQNPELVSYLHPKMKDFLEASFGLIVYQDDVLFTAIELAGYDWHEADKFRKAIGKKIIAEMEKQKIKFFQGCRTKSKMKEENIKLLWQQIEPFVAYGFNKAHAASYGMVAYQTSYMKANYPVQYMAAVLQAEAGDNDKVPAVVHECRRMGIEVLPPDVSESFKSFAMVSKPGEKGRIRFGLNAIKNLGDHICEVIYRERKNNGPYKNLEDFLERIQDKDLNKKSLESLSQSGALDCFDFDRGVLMANIENILFYLKQYREKQTSNQESLFAGTEIALDSQVTIKDAAKATMDQKLIWEKELLGIYLSSHPFKYYEEVMGDKLLPIMDIEDYPRDEWVTLGGVIDDAKKKITKRGDIMMFVTLQDQTGAQELLIFPKTYEKTRDIWQEGKIVCIVGRTSREQGDNKVFVENVYELNKENVDQVASMISGALKQHTSRTVKIDHGHDKKKVEIEISKIDLKEKTEELKQLFDAYPGECRVYLNIDGNYVRTQTEIIWDEEMQVSLEEIVGEGRVRISNS